MEVFFPPCKVMKGDLVKESMQQLEAPLSSFRQFTSLLILPVHILLICTSKILMDFGRPSSQKVHIIATAHTLLISCQSAHCFPRLSTDHSKSWQFQAHHLACTTESNMRLQQIEIDNVTLPFRKA